MIVVENDRALKDMRDRWYVGMKVMVAEPRAFLRYNGHRWEEFTPDATFEGEMGVNG